MKTRAQKKTVFLRSDDDNDVQKIKRFLGCSQKDRMPADVKNERK
jgi:hypothetical protein